MIYAFLPLPLSNMGMHTVQVPKAGAWEAGESPTPSKATQGIEGKSNAEISRAVFRWLN